MSTKARLCENCGGKLEVGYTWQRVVVCSTCYGQLSAPRPAAVRSSRSRGLWPGVIGIIVVATAIAAAVVMTRSHGAASSSHDNRQVVQAVAVQNPTVPLAPDMSADLEDHHRLHSLGSSELAVSQPASSQATVSISGIVRLSRKDGSSDALRGLRLQLLKPTVGRKAVQTCLAAEARVWKEVADAYSAPTADSSSTNAAGNTAADSAADGQEIADDANAGMLRVQAASEAVPKEMDAADALRMLTDLSLFNVPYFDDAAADAVAQETRTDADGKYEFQNVAPGDYYLHAARTSNSSFVEWCAPVHVDGDGRTNEIDLTNDNAAVYHSIR